MNRMKALYPIKLPKSSGDASEVARASEQVNEEHLNDNFRTITSELVKLWEGGERQLNIMSSRMTETETGLAATNTIINGIQVDVAENTSAIEQRADAIMTAVSTTLEGYAPIVYVNEATGALDTKFETANANIESSVAQYAEKVEVQISTTEAIGTEVNKLMSWVRIVTRDEVHDTNAGVIIGDSQTSTSLKAEAGAIYFYRGDDTQAKSENQLAGFDADGNFVANTVHTASTLLDGKFDIDVVTANSVDFLHITGRN